MVLVFTGMLSTLVTGGWGSGVSPLYDGRVLLAPTSGVAGSLLTEVGGSP